eukprot:TRINITY_DN17601_c0_g1_i1.p1 TRINITY_DN17601_c0_g1~~TRINITY_DN17601_c0_g1_i1.p1  ORF type:complete len:435 (-),score=179.99 TRINITY_DN17601_c0_g1_i1:152-1405(-)
MKLKTVVVSGLAVAAVPAAGVSLRQSEASRHVAVKQDPEIATPEEIHEKWDKMDEFLKVMFTMACKWKHGKDVNGLAAEKLKAGELAGDEVEGFKKDVHSKNLQGVKSACGMIVANGRKNCRQGCADRWGTVKDKRAECDKACVDTYAKFEKRCTAQADNLEKVYEMKIGQAAARKQCYEGHCDGFPTVWMKTDAAGMEEERTKQCENKCTEDAIKITCRQKWQLEVDFIMGDITSKCFEEGKVKECYKGKETEAGTTQETCSTDGKKSCEDAFTKCETDGKTSDNFKSAAEFCADRKKMCEEQVVEKCLAEHKKELETAQKTCESEDAERMKTCESEKLEEKQKGEEEKCIGEKTPKCPEDCAAKCPVDKLEGCLKNLEGSGDASEAFCEDFWNLLHQSSEVDPVTGNPIVLLSSK